MLLHLTAPRHVTEAQLEELAFWGILAWSCWSVPTHIHLVGIALDIASPSLWVLFRYIHSFGGCHRPRLKNEEYEVPNLQGPVGLQV